MIKRQLKLLSNINECILFEKVVYERLFKDKKDLARLRKKYKNYGFKHKYRYFISCDDYDYVTDSKLVNKLNKFFKEEDKFLRSNRL